MHLTRYSNRTLLFSFRPSPIPHAPASPIWLLICKTHVTPQPSQSKNIPRLHNKQTIKNMHLTSTSFFTLRISPDFMRAANAMQSASVTPQPLATISSLSTSNSRLPNFTFAMQYVNPADAPAPTFSLPKSQKKTLPLPST